VATIYPSVRPSVSDKVSRAERDVLDSLALLPDDWCVIHSLWLKTHNVKLHAEADFIVITDRAAFILEIKGGNVWRDDAGWHFVPKHGGQGSIKSQGPFDQARGAYYSIRDHLANCGRSQLFDDHVWGYGVVCPECALNIREDDAFVSPRMLLDERGFPGSLDAFLESLTKYWTERYQKSDINGVRFSKSRQDSISRGRRADIVSALRPEFELVVGPGASSVHAERDLLTLTSQQLTALDFISMEPRNLLVGSAGTGKTILAVEQARRKASEGKRVLFLCFNRLLAKKLAGRFSTIEPGRLVAGNYHQVVLSLCDRKGLERPFAESWDGFQLSLQDALEEIFSRLDDEDYFDYLVVDEAQDLMSESFMELMDYLLRGGLKDGSWMMACDIQQAIFRGNFNQNLMDKMSSWSRKTALKVNCRNTRQVAAYVTGISGVGSPVTQGIDGETPIVRYFEDRNSYLRLLRKLVNELIQSFLDAKLPLSEIAILYGSSDYVPQEIMAPGFFLRTVRTTAEISPLQDDCIQVCSIQGFKGLEARAVVLVGIEDLTTTLWRDLFYVGASRAKTNLRIILPASCQEVKASLVAITELLMDKGTVQQATEPLHV
jgi:hypothetical protein